MIHAQVLPEPELEFGAAARHIDPRFGISTYGPADLLSASEPRAIRVGLVGGAAEVEGLRAWLARCKDPIDAKDERYPHLFPAFPGCDIDRGLYTTLVLSDRATNIISPRILTEIDAATGARALDIAVEAYCEEARSLAEQNRVDVILIARPEQLRDTRPRRAHGTQSEPTLHESNVDADVSADVTMQFANFHDLIKARLLTLTPPIQIIRRSTWDEATRPPVGHSRQDEASRAWNLHVALYYKAGGVPWRMLRDPYDYTTCYVGVSFYRSDNGGTLETAVAQVFNERGDGVIVRGGAALRSTDRQPHLSGQAAHDLLTNALDVYRREHKTLPARLALHKASSFTDEEADGFRQGADTRKIDALDLAWVTNSDGIRLYRRGNAPPLRGTFLDLSDDQSILYSQGSIDFYSTYPGMYIPSPIGLRHLNPTLSPIALAREVLALTKMNWNQTRLDSKLPVTLRTAEQVKRVLRFCDPNQQLATRYAHYM